MVAEGKMLVVSGEPRSGTSLMMKTIEALGIPVSGEQFMGEAMAAGDMERVPEEKRAEARANLEKRVDRMKELNPGGFYEMAGIVMQGIREINERVDGKAIKIITPGIMDRVAPNGRSTGTPMEIIDKIIFCLRDPRNVSLSQTNLDSMVEVAGLGQDWERFKNMLSPMRYMGSMGQFAAWYTGQSDEVKAKFLFVDYDAYIDDPQATVDAVVAHAESGSTAEQIAAAVGNVDESLRRSTEFTGWPENQQIEGDLSVQIYQAFKAQDAAAIAAGAAGAQENMQQKALEASRWTDEETWVDTAAGLYRSMMTDENSVKTNLIASLGQKREAGLIPDVCQYYSRDEANPYTVQRPADLGDLTRPTVKCARDNDNKPVEQCKVCWQRGWVVNGEPVGPQMKA
jgi:hypothetical protein